MVRRYLIASSPVAKKRSSGIVPGPAPENAVAVPDFQTLMLPTLRLTAAGPIRTGDLVVQLADAFGLSAEDREEMLPGGRQRRMANRCHWAVAYLGKAGLISRVRRGEYEATASGRALLQAPPDRMTLPFLLDRYPGIRSFRGLDDVPAPAARSTVDATTASGPAPAETLTETPDERLDRAEREMKAALAAELLDRRYRIGPDKFERLIVDLLVKMGYGGSREEAGSALGRSGDGGVDGLIREDALGLDAIYIQAKRYAEDSPIGPAMIQAFAGALLQKGATKGVFVTTSRFTAAAKAVVEGLRGNQRIILIDGDELARLLINHEVGVRTERTIRKQRIDLEPYEDDEPV